jgi:hypothetical protein
VLLISTYYIILITVLVNGGASAYLLDRWELGGERGR